MFKVYHKISPVVFGKLFIRNSDLHDYETRQANQFHVPYARTNYMLTAISVKGVNVWNEVSMKINFDCSYLSFKMALKKYIFNNPDTIEYIS